MQGAFELLFPLISGFPFPKIFSVSDASNGWGLNLTRGVTDISNLEYDIHMLAFYICCAIAAIVFGLMIYAMFAFRKSANPTPATFSHSTKLEIIWTVIPVIILVLLAIPATKALITMEDTSASDMTIKIVGAQWKWKYEYVGENLEFYSSLDAKSNEIRRLSSNLDPSTYEHYLLNVDKPLVVPTGKKIKLLVTSVDVIHAWWVPALGIKKDAIPGYMNRAWFSTEIPGTYRGQCAELCGRDHAFMPIVVKVLPVEEYQEWLENQTTKIERSVAQL